MIAVDTNLIIRYLTGDHPEQAARARDIVDRRDVFVPITVMMEVEWVLPSSYRFNRLQISDAIRIFAGMPTVTLEDSGAVAAALDLLNQGVDFADALHLVKAQHCEEFITFDRKFLKAAHAAGYSAIKGGMD